MSFEDFKKFTKGNGWKKVAVIATVVSAHQAHAMANEHKDNDRKDAKIETVAKSDNVEEKNLAGVAKLELVRADDGSVVPVINDNIVVNGLEPLKDLKKDYKKEQKEAFAEAEPDGVETVSIAEHDIFPAYGYYNPSYKNITRRVIEDDKETLKEYVESEELDEEDFYKTLEDMQDENSPLSQAVLSHEAQHKVNDQTNVYAPGLNAEQYGKLNCWDEVSANIAMLALLNHEYQEQISKGVSQEEALKLFDEPMSERFAFYKEALQKGLKPDSKEAKKMMVQGTLKMWQENYQTMYEEQTKNTISEYSKQGNIASVLIGDDKEYHKRVEKMLDSIDENPLLKKEGVKIGNLSKYLPEKDIELSPELKEYASKQTQDFTQMTPEQGQEISKQLPGSQKKDIKTLLKILTGRKTVSNVPIVDDFSPKAKENFYADQRYTRGKYSGR